MDMKNKKRYTSYVVIGYLTMLLLFSIGLFIILTITKKLPYNWTYLHLLSISCFIVIFGRSLKVMFKR